MTSQYVNGSGSVRRRRPVVRLIAARVLDAIGWPGVFGIAMLAVTAIWLGSEWKGHRDLERRSIDASATPVRLQIEEPRSEQLAPLRSSLPRRDEVPSLLARIALAARTSDLGWPAADYRVNPETSERLATLEVRCKLEGPYPKLRRFLAEILRTVHGTTIRELQISRPSSESTDVEARVVFQVFLDDEGNDVGTTVPKRTTP